MATNSFKISKPGLIAIFAIAAAAIVLPLTRSLAQSAEDQGPIGIIGGPWRIADENPIRPTSSPWIICVTGAERADGEVQLVLLTTADTKLSEGIRFTGTDDKGNDHNFIEVSSSRSKNFGVPASQYLMRVYQLETPEATGFRIVSIAMEGNTREALEAEAREKYFRARSDMRSVATGIESYFVDYAQYPASTEDVSKSIHASLPGKGPSAAWSLPTFQIGAPIAGVDPNSPDWRGLAPATLTTPVAYLTSLFQDPFTKEEGHTFQYFSITSTTIPTAKGMKDGKLPGWVAWSPGPDGKYDLAWQNYDPNDTTKTLKAFAPQTYDPSNGTISPGDLWRIKQQSFN